MSQNMQAATNAAVDGMKLFQNKINSSAIQNGQFERYKGNLFEYIEAAKFNTVAARAGSQTRAVVTDAVGRSADATDIELINNGKVIEQVQAKFSSSKNAAADSVFMQRNPKYAGMQRLIRKDENYIDSATGERTTLLDKAKSLAKKNAEKEGHVFQKEYKDTYENLTDELHSGDISSGGTTLEEIQSADKNPSAYIKSFERKQVLGEMKASATNMAKASFVTSGIVSGVTNMFEVFRDEKSLADAFHDVGADAVKGAVRGGATGVISTVIRYQGVKAGNALLSDGLASTVMAGGLIDGGVALYSYAKGEIDHKELLESLVDTTVKSTTTIYFTKAVTAIMGKAVSPIIPLTVYTAASYVFTATKEIIKNAKLNEEEHNRMAALLEESTKQIDEYNQQLHNYLSRCEANQRRIMNEFMTSFNYNLETGENYDEAILAISKFAEQAGIALKYAEFDDFSAAMKNKVVFSLE
ncbi:MAG: hypothetical protein IKK32_07360 [Oscillospiraceae bacterium]|nr:hypothetical protein [Oscillospiraceae bacterium]